MTMVLSGNLVSHGSGLGVVCPGPKVLKGRVCGLEALTQKIGESQVDESLNLHPPAIRRPAWISSVLYIEDLYIILFIKITLLLKKCWNPSPALFIQASDTIFTSA